MKISDNLLNILDDIQSNTENAFDNISKRLKNNVKLFKDALLESNLYDEIDLSKDFYVTVSKNDIKSDITTASLIRRMKVGNPNDFGSLIFEINTEAHNRYPYINQSYIDIHNESIKALEGVSLSTTDTKPKVNVSTNKSDDTNKDTKEKDKPLTEEEQYKLIIAAGKEVKVDPNWNNDPMDVKNTFLSLVQKTYPYKTESQLLPLLTELCKSEIITDEFGNYYTIVGENPNTMFTSHLDTKCTKQEDVTVIETILRDTPIWFTNGKTILGADDKSGVTAMLYMIAHGVKGIYYFFIGEEVGGLGSDYVASNFSEMEHLSNVNKVVSFDRRKKNSIITHQRFGDCCSQEFAKALGKELGLKPDEGGMFTDSANFTDIVPECTNLSIGYANEHTNYEYQNINFLVEMCDKYISIDWEKLPIVREIGFPDEVYSENKKLIDELYDIEYYNVPTIRYVNGSLQLTILNSSTEFITIDTDISDIYQIVENYNLLDETSIIFGNNGFRINIKLKK